MIVNTITRFNAVYLPSLGARASKALIYCMLHKVCIVNGEEDGIGGNASVLGALGSKRVNDKSPLHYAIPSIYVAGCVQGMTGIQQPPAAL